MRHRLQKPAQTGSLGLSNGRQVFGACTFAIALSQRCSEHSSTLSIRLTAETMPRSAARTVGCALLFASVEVHAFLAKAPRSFAAPRAARAPAPR